MMRTYVYMLGDDSLRGFFSMAEGGDLCGFKVTLLYSTRSKMGDTGDGKRGEERWICYISGVVKCMRVCMCVCGEDMRGKEREYLLHAVQNVRT